MIADLRWFKWPSLSKNKKPALSRLYLSDPEVSPGSAFSSPAWNCSLTQTARPQFLSCLLVPRFLPIPLGSTISPDSFLLWTVYRILLKASSFSHSWASGSNSQPGPWNLGFVGREPIVKESSLHRREPSRCLFIWQLLKWSNCYKMGPCVRPLNPPPLLPHHQIHNQVGTSGKTNDERDFHGYKGHCWIVNSLWKLCCQKSGSEINEINSKARSE